MWILTREAHNFGWIQTETYMNQDFDVITQIAKATSAWQEIDIKHLLFKRHLGIFTLVWETGHALWEPEHRAGIHQHQNHDLYSLGREVKHPPTR